MSGPPATGKTTLARSLGVATGWPVLRSDEIRAERYFGHDMKAERPYHPNELLIGNIAEFGGKTRCNAGRNATACGQQHSHVVDVRA